MLISQRKSIRPVRAGLYLVCPNASSALDTTGMFTSRMIASLMRFLRHRKQAERNYHEYAHHMLLNPLQKQLFQTARKLRTLRAQQNQQLVAILILGEDAWDQSYRQP